METLVQALEYFFNNYIVAIAVIACALGYSIWKISARFQKMKSKIESLDSLPCTIHATKLDEHDKSNLETRVLLGRMEGQLELLVQNSIAKGSQKIQRKAASTFSAKRSPRKLNQNGEFLLENCGGKDFLAKHLEYFLKKIDELSPKTALDVENVALAVLQMSTGEDIFNGIKDWIYNAPAMDVKLPDGKNSKKEIDLDDVLFVLSLPLRDEYLKRKH